MTKTASGLPASLLKASASEDATAASYWAPRVRRELAGSVEAILRAGNQLAEAKAACAHGEFGKLFDADGPEYVGLGARSAQRLMEIAADPVLANPTHASHLPPSWMTLHELSRLPDEVKEQGLESGAITAETTRRDVVLLSRPAVAAAPARPLPAGTFDVLLADPPWQYDFAESETRAIENQYPTMDAAAIASLKVPSSEDAVLFCWATSPKLREALEVVGAWGFEYVTHMVWVKDKIGMGYYARQQHELLLIGRRGRPGVPEPGDRPSSVFESPRTEHSRKPALAYDLIETMYPDRTYLELFARSGRDGWTSWGNEI